jgi:CSLREA domain-containing protein
MLFRKLAFCCTWIAFAFLSTGCALTVTTLGDHDDGTCDDADCSLREAINAANKNTVKQLIRFDTSQGSINLTSPLPVVSQPIKIDGTTHPAYVDSPVVGINGNGHFVGADCLVITAGDSLVKGITVANCWGDGIRLENNGGNKIVGTHVNTCHQRGIFISSSQNVIGGPTAADRNVISSNNSSGIRIEGAGADGNVIQGSYIGLDETGKLKRANHSGISIETNSNVVGGTGAGEGNVISGNWCRGMYVSGNGNVIQGNLFGVTADGATSVHNGCHGISLVGDNNNVGGVAAGAGNTVAYSQMDGITVSGVQNNVRRNSIHTNAGIGINLCPLGCEGVSPNDPGDADSGGNQMQNYPLLTSATSVLGNVTVEGVLQSTPGEGFTIEFFKNSSCDVSGFGQGAEYLADFGVATTGNGEASFIAGFPVGVVAAGDFITATATDGSGNTSEFSACIEVTGE